MSLLMEALRKAEAAKKKAQQEGSADAAQSASTAAPVTPKPEPPVPEPEQNEQVAESISLEDEWIDPELPRVDDDEIELETSPLDFDLDFLADDQYSDSTGNAELEISVDSPEDEPAPLAHANTQEDEIDFGDSSPASVAPAIDLDLDGEQPAASGTERVPETGDASQEGQHWDSASNEQAPEPKSDEGFSLDGAPVIVADRLAVSGSAELQEDEQTIDFEAPPEPKVDSAEASVDNDSYSTFEFDSEGLDSQVEADTELERDSSSLETVTFNEPTQLDSAEQDVETPPSVSKTGLTTRDLIDESEPDFSMDADANEFFADEDSAADKEAAPTQEVGEAKEDEEVDEFEKATRALLQKEEIKAAERSEFEKQHASKLSARSIFAAKKGAGSGSKKRVLLAGSSIAALLLIGAGAYYYFLILPGSGGMGFSSDFSSVSSIPQQSIPQEPVVVDESAAADGGGGVATTTIDDFVEELPLESAFTVVIGEDSTTVEEVLPGSQLSQSPAQSSGQPEAPLEAPPGEVTQQGTATSQELASQALPTEEVSPAGSVPTESASSELAVNSQAEAVITDSTPQTEESRSAGTETAPQVSQVASSGTAATTGNDTESAQTAAASSMPTPPGSGVAADIAAAISFNPASANRINFRKTAPDEDINPLIDRAYAAYQRGVTSLAKQLYQEVLDDSPYHRDALLGLAAIAAANRETLIALQYYDRILARYPNDPIARAARLEYAPPGTDVSQERELKELAAANPDAPSLPYALGNLFASQQKWSQAQQAYFDALSLAKATASRGGGPVNPDYAFNLAVSLEHLRQGTSAEIYYREALEFANRHFASFDVQRLRARLESNNRTPQ